MEQCSICLEALDGGVVALAACGHRFHAACLAQMAGAVGTATKWRSSMFPGREFDDLDAYRAAKKQRAARREEYSARIRETTRGYPW